MNSSFSDNYKTNHIPIMKTLQHLHALACAALLAGAVSAQAFAPVSVTFDITWSSGPLSGTTSKGNFCYDSMVLTGVGEESLGSNTGLLSLDLVVNGKAFSMTDDLLFGTPSGPSGLDPNFPLVKFEAGVFAGLDFQVDTLVINDMNQQVESGEYLFLNLLATEYEDARGYSQGTITVVSSVAKPVPDAGSTASLLVAGLGAISLARRKRKR
jgi:hypothetical protein